MADERELSEIQSNREGVVMSGSMPGRGKAWSRPAVVASIAALATLAGFTIMWGPLSAEGAGRIFGMFLPASILTSVIATIRPRFRRWGPTVVLFVSVFLALFLLAALGNPERLSVERFSDQS